MDRFRTPGRFIESKRPGVHWNSQITYENQSIPIQIRLEIKIDIMNDWSKKDLGSFLPTVEPDIGGTLWYFLILNNRIHVLSLFIIYFLIEISIIYVCLDEYSANWIYRNAKKF